MYYKFIKGKNKGKLIVAIDENEETGIITAQDGSEHAMNILVRLTPEEEEKYVKVEKIEL